MLIFLLVKVSSAQSAKTSNPNSEVHQYYIYVSGITAKTDVELIETKIQKMAGVSYFLGNRYPVRYFLLKSPTQISKSTFASWIGAKFKVEFFGEGDISKEDAILTGINLEKKSQQINKQ